MRRKFSSAPWLVRARLCYAGRGAQWSPIAWQTPGRRVRHRANQKIKFSPKKAGHIYRESVDFSAKLITIAGILHVGTALSILRIWFTKLVVAVYASEQ